MQCRLCGYRFEVNSLTCHAGCPFGDRCHLVCCPNCGYQVVDDSRSPIARFLDRLFRRGARSSEDQERSRRVLDHRVVPLSHMAAGTQAVIRHMDPMPDGRANRLTVFGVSPGAHVTVVQRHPAPVVRVGETELALGREVLDMIWVDAEPETAPAVTGEADQR